jgi:hypothetical protein
MKSAVAILNNFYNVKERWQPLKLMHPLRNFCDPWCQKGAFPDMCVLTKYSQIEPIYLPHSVVTYISLHSVYTSMYMQGHLNSCETGDWFQFVLEWTEN